ncbi:hypothetical protein SDC9_114871 [bioreactor metagenome]|uniref:Uncharacterized protein n=1 Tax=bioreactor metagenome TaxID=1076179 RepID=A0A645BRF8_9ZZZZ
MGSDAAVRHRLLYCDRGGGSQSQICVPVHRRRHGSGHPRLLQSGGSGQQLDPVRGCRPDVDPELRRQDHRFRRRRDRHRLRGQNRQRRSRVECRQPAADQRRQTLPRPQLRRRHRDFGRTERRDARRLLRQPPHPQGLRRAALRFAGQ